MKTGIELIADERQRQIYEENFTPANDRNYDASDLAIAAACYALPSEKRESDDNSFVPMPNLWPWLRKWWKPTPENRIRELQKAGALIAAEIDRLQYKINKNER